MLCIPLQLNYLQFERSSGGKSMFTQQQQQLQTQQRRRSSSDGSKARSQRRYRGVRRRKWGRWVSEIRMPHKRGRIWLGSYDSACKAALAYDFASFCLSGRLAKLNFPERPPFWQPEFRIPTSPRSIQAAANQFAEQHHSCYSVSPKSAVAAATSATLSEGCSVSSSSSSGSHDNSLNFEATGGNRGSQQLLALDLDFGVLDNLSQFLKTHSHTEWWLG